VTPQTPLQKQGKRAGRERKKKGRRKGRDREREWRWPTH